MEAIPRGRTGDVLARQIIRSGTSVGAQYREACRARSAAEFISKVESATQELDETVYWLELIADSDLIAASRIADLQSEANELIAIFTTSVLTARSRLSD